MMDKFLNWLLVSSADVNEWSLTIKGATVLVPTIVLFGNLAHVQFSSETLTSIVDTISTVVLYTGSILSGLATAIGLGRKVYLTITGKNVIME